MPRLAHFLVREKVFSRLEMLVAFEQSPLNAGVQGGAVLSQNVAQQLSVSRTGRIVLNDSVCTVIHCLDHHGVGWERLVGRSSGRRQDGRWKKKEGKRE